MPSPTMHPALQRALTERGYDDLTPVQSAVLAADAGGRDLLVSAQTGSGKTVAYGLALANTMLGDEERLPTPGLPMVLVVAPTRELAMQVHGELTWLYAYAGARVVSCIGGMEPRRERIALEAGCHIVVGTPGRLRDHLERGRLDTSALRAVVLDEADEMLDMGFREDLQFILDTTPDSRRTLLFSATIAAEIASLARQYQRDAMRIDTVARNKPHGDIEYRAVSCAPNEIENTVVNVLRFFEARGCLVFCATREAVRHLHARLLERGFAAVILSGELGQNERTAALQSLRDGRSRVCIATDVAARGLDLPDLDLVVHAELPTNREMLLHRSGRTGRAGRKGVCVLLVPFTRRRRAEQLLQSANIRASWGAPPAADEIRARDQERLAADSIFVDPLHDDEAVQAQHLLAAHPAEAIAAALIRLHRSRLPEPEELFTGPKVGSFRAAGDVRPDYRSSDPDGQDRESRAPRGETSGSVWFRAHVGRRNNADPKWLIPLICRVGVVTKKDIGVIRIFDHDTKFEIAPHAAARFAEALAAAGDSEIRIELAAAPPAPRAPAPGFRRKPPKTSAHQRAKG